MWLIWFRLKFRVPKEISFLVLENATHLLIMGVIENNENHIKNGLHFKQIIIYFNNATTFTQFLTSNLLKNGLVKEV